MTKEFKQATARRRESSATTDFPGKRDKYQGTVLAAGPSPKGVHLLIGHANVCAPEGEEFFARFEFPEPLFLVRKIFSAIDFKRKTKIRSSHRGSRLARPSVLNFAGEVRGIKRAFALGTYAPNTS